MTTKQLSQRIKSDLDNCGAVLWELQVHGLVVCLSPKARRSRVFGLTPQGEECRARVARHQKVEGNTSPYFCPAMDWEIYAWVCYSHRSVIIKAMDRSLQPSAIKRRARMLYPDIRMSANNVRDNIRLMKEKGIVAQVWERKRAHPRYSLTSLGNMLRELLLRADFTPSYL